MVCHSVGTLVQFLNTVRYIYRDDLLTPSFEDTIVDIYPIELVLKKTTELYYAFLLGYQITTVEHKYITAVWDKRDSFNFHIVNYSFMCGNIPAGPAYGIYISQLVQFGRICVNYEDFVGRHKLMTGRLINLGYRYSRLHMCYKKFMRRYDYF